MPREAWGRWGDADEVGALNFVTPQDVIAATGLVRQGKMMSLTQPLSKNTPVPAHRHAMQHFMDRDGGDYKAGIQRAHGFQFAEDTILLPLHIGTHIDGLCHAWCEDKLYNGHSSHEITSTAGAKKCGVDKLPPIVTRGILLDVTLNHYGPLPVGYSIGRAELEDVAQRAGVVPRRGDAVLIRTGWLEAQADKAARDIDFNSEAGIDEAAALWLAEADVSLIGADNFAIEAMPFPEGEIFPVHQRLLRDYGIPLLEGAVLAPLATSGVAEFLFVATPMPIVGGTGSPVAPVAIF